MDHLTYTWWKEAVGYQIYPKTFKDGNHDGFGDLKGVIEKIPYLHDLGIDFIWICPFFDSPMDDNGYDVRDFYKVDKMFGTIEDFKQLVSICDSYNIKIVVDLVLNHTSDEHEWFQKAKQHEKHYEDYYFMKHASHTPTNWGSFFGGSAWERLADNTYYLRIFSKKMPDLNWSNPVLREEMYEIARYWMNLGVAGFRLDAIAHLAKDMNFANSTKPEVNGVAYDWSKFSNLPAAQTYLKEFKEHVLQPLSCFSVGEVGGGASVDDALEYVSYDDGKLNIVFTFDHVWCNNINTANSIEDLKIDAPKLKETLAYWQTSLFHKGWSSLYLNNHDFNRVVSNYGSVKYHNKSAKALATMMYFLWGTPFIYQGEEIGMTNYPFTSIDDFNDVQALEQYRNKPEAEKATFFTKLKLSSRDNVRTTMQWDTSTLGGFSTKAIGLLTNPNYQTINVASQLEDENSILNYYKQVIKLKKQIKTLLYGNIEFIELHPDVMCYKRYDEHQTYLVIVNLSCDKVSLPTPIDTSNVLLSNTHTSSILTHLEPYDAFLLQINN